MKRLALALSSVLALSAATAATVSFEYGLQPLQTAPIEINQSGSLGLFDSSLGTLTGASLTLFSAALFEFAISNPNTQATVASAVAESRITWTSPLMMIGALLPDPLSLQLATGPQTIASGQTLVFGPLSQIQESRIDLDAAVSSLTGSGSFELNCSSLSGFTVTGAGALAFTNATQAGCGARLVYTYTPDAAPPGVPEPGTLALALPALLALLAGRAVTANACPWHRRRSARCCTMKSSA